MQARRKDGSAEDVPKSSVRVSTRECVLHRMASVQQPTGDGGHTSDEPRDI